MLPKDFAHFHPMLVHFPIVCVLCVLLFEWIALVRRREMFGPGVPLLLAIGVIIGTVAIFSGFQLEDDVKGGFEETARALMERHEISAIVAMSAGFLALVLGILHRRAPMRWKRIGYLVLLHVAAGSVAIAGQAGGCLVWE